MGQLISRKRPSARDTLEKIENELHSIEDRKRLRIQREQFVLTYLLCYIPVFILILAHGWILFSSSNSILRDKFILSVPIVFLHIILYTIRMMTKSYFRWSLESDESRLRKLHNEKQGILEKVCETENFKVASEILEKYDPKRLRRERKIHEPQVSPFETTLSKISASPIRAPKAMSKPSTPQLNISHMIASPQPVPMPMPSIFTATPQAKNTSFLQPNLNFSLNSNYIVEGPRGKPVKPMLSKERSFLDKAVDWVVADGPWNRFALICEHCSAHNGMVLEDEFQNLNYRCGYCLSINYPPVSLRKTPDFDKINAQEPKKQEDKQAKEVENKLTSDKSSPTKGSNVGDGPKKGVSDKDSDDTKKKVEDSQPVRKIKIKRRHSKSKEATSNAGEKEEFEVLDESEIADKSESPSD